jgi:hypothetical protein
MKHGHKNNGTTPSSGTGTALVDKPIDQTPSQPPTPPTPPAVNQEPPAPPVASANVATPPKQETPVDTTPKGGETPKATPAETAIATIKASITDEKQQKMAIDSITNIATAIPDPEMQGKAIETLLKLFQGEKESAEARKFVAFDNELKERLPSLFEELSKKNGVDLSNRKITITFPEGKPSYVNCPKDAKSNGDSKRESSFPSKWGKATGPDGTEHKSPSALAEVLGLQVTGHRDMVDVFENPTKTDGTKLEKGLYKVDAKKGEYFRVTKAK